VKGLPAFDVQAIDLNEWTLWRYAAMLPTTCSLSLGEGLTPLVAVAGVEIPFRAKLEFFAPTASYKDRGTAVLVNHLIAHDVHKVVEDSSGNAGSSLAAYTGVAGIQARIFVPSHASEAKKHQITLFGAELVEVPGARSSATVACLAGIDKAIYASHAWSPFFLAGLMTCAWEVWEQMGHRAPDAVVCVVEQGGLLLGFARGFKALSDAGLIKRLPRLYAVQPTNRDPITRAWQAGLIEPVSTAEWSAIADGIQVPVPVRANEILSAVRESGGAVFRVEEPAILEAHIMLAKQGLFVEPISATPIAALAMVQAHLGAGGDIVVPLTGSGLKHVSSPLHQHNQIGQAPPPPQALPGRHARFD